MRRRDPPRGEAKIARRPFLASLVGAAAAWPLAAHAQQAGKLPTVGILGTDTSSWTPWTSALVKRLRELGWIEGRTIAFEYRWDEGRQGRVAEIAAEFVRLNVDAIVTYGTAVPLVQQATPIIPIIFAIASDPVAGGLVASLARPGGNVTGMSQQAADAAGKKLELLRQVVPNLRRLAVMINVGNPQTVAEMNDVQVAARALGLEVVPLEIRREGDIDLALDALNGHADALYVVAAGLLHANRTRIIARALGARLPTIFYSGDFVLAGGLMSYGPSYPDMFRRAGDMVDKVLRGTKPTDIPVEQPTKFEFLINLKTAKALGLTVPPTLLVAADEVIE